MVWKLLMRWTFCSEIFCGLVCTLPIFVLRDSQLSIHRWSEKWYIWLFAIIAFFPFKVYSYCHEKIWIILQTTSFSLCKKETKGKIPKAFFVVFCFYLYIVIAFILTSSLWQGTLSIWKVWKLTLNSSWKDCEHYAKKICYTLHVAGRAGWEYRQCAIKEIKRQRLLEMQKYINR